MNTKKLLVIASGLIVLLTSCGMQREEKVAQPIHFVVNGVTYWESSYLTCSSIPDSFQLAGEIKEMTADAATEDWQSHDLPVDTKIYLDPAMAYQAWDENGRRYCTADAARRYLFCENELYVYLGSVNRLDGDYYEAYREQWDMTIKPEELPKEAVYLGASVFEGYDRYPEQQLGSNSLTEPHSVYQDAADPNILFVLSNEENRVYVYVKVPDSAVDFG